VTVREAEGVNRKPGSQAVIGFAALDLAQLAEGDTIGDSKNAFKTKAGRMSDD